MHSPTRFALSTLSPLLAASILLGSGCAVDGETIDATGESLRIVAPSAQDMPEAARAAIIDAVQGRADAAGPWSVLSMRWEETWALGTLTSADLDQPLPEGEESHLSLGNMYAVLLVQTERGWEAALEGDAYVHELLAHVPESGLSLTARNAMFPKKGQESDKVYSGYKFFWPAGNAWRVTQGWHDSYTWGSRYPAYTSLDLDITGATNSDILAGAPGTVSHMCNDGTQVLVGVTTSGTSERVGYLHLSSSSVASAGIYEGMSVSMGTKLGRMVNSDGGAVVTGCGGSYGTHLHAYLPSQNITIDGVSFTSGNVHYGENLYSTQGSGTSPTEIIVDDTSGGFTKFGPSGYWWEAAIGYGSHMWYTYVNGTVKSNYVQWKPSLPSAGYYTVYAFIPSNHATSLQAQYRIYHNGTNNYSTVNQNNYYNQWVSLGQHYFSDNGTEYVELSDATGEASSTGRKIGFDAVKFVK